MAIDRDTLIIITLMGGPPAAVSWILYEGATYLGPRIKTRELLPLLPFEGPPIPKFVRTKPDVAKGLWETMKIVEKASQVR